MRMALLARRLIVASIIAMMLVFPDTARAEFVRIEMRIVGMD